MFTKGLTLHEPGRVMGVTVTCVEGCQSEPGRAMGVTVTCIEGCQSLNTGEVYFVLL